MFKTVFDFLKKRQAIKSYVKVLPVVLKRKFGKQKHYSENNIRDAITSANLSTKFIDYAFAIFLSEKVFRSISRDDAALNDYATMKKTIAKRYFKNNTKFTIHDLLKNANYRINIKLHPAFDGNVSGSESVD